MPVIGPMTGGFVASLLYSLFIEIHWPPLESRNKAEEVDVKDEGKENPKWKSKSHFCARRVHFIHIYTSDLYNCVRFIKVTCNSVHEYHIDLTVNKALVIV